MVYTDIVLSNSAKSCRIRPRRNMGPILFSMLLLVSNPDGLAKEPNRLCVLDPAQMPVSWRPSVELQKSLNPAPWSPKEAKDAKYAIKTGVEEMIAHFKRKPSAVQDLWDDSIEALIQVTYASANEPEFDAKVRDAARNNLTALITPYLDLDPETATCAEFRRLLPLVLFAHRLYPAHDTRTDVVTKRTNAAFRACSSFEAATKDYFRTILGNKDARAQDIEQLFELYIWSLWLIEAELYPDIELPVEARKFGPKVWRYFESYRLAGANEFEEGAEQRVHHDRRSRQPHRPYSDRHAPVSALCGGLAQSLPLSPAELLCGDAVG